MDNFIINESVNDRFVCYGHYDPNNGRCGADRCPWSKDSSCPDSTRIKHLRNEIERKANDNSKSEP